MSVSLWIEYVESIDIINLFHRIAPPVYNPQKDEESGDTKNIMPWVLGWNDKKSFILYAISDLRPDLLYASFSPRNQFRRRALFNFKENKNLVISCMFLASLIVMDM